MTGYKFHPDKSQTINMGPRKKKLSYFYSCGEDESDATLKAVSMQVALALAEQMWGMSERCCHGEVKVYLSEVIKITVLHREQLIKLFVGLF